MSSEHRTRSLCSGPSFHKDVYGANSLGRQSVSLWRRGQACAPPDRMDVLPPSGTMGSRLTLHSKRFWFSRLRSPLLKGNPLCVQMSPVSLCIALWELGLGNLPARKCHLFWLLLLLWVITHIVADPEVLGLPPASVNCGKLTC